MFVLLVTWHVRFCQVLFRQLVMKMYLKESFASEVHGITGDLVWGELSEALFVVWHKSICENTAVLHKYCSCPECWSSASFLVAEIWCIKFWKKKKQKQLSLHFLLLLLANKDTRKEEGKKNKKKTILHPEIVCGGGGEFMTSYFTQGVPHSFLNGEGKIYLTPQKQETRSGKNWAVCFERDCGEKTRFRDFVFPTAWLQVCSELCTLRILPPTFVYRVKAYQVGDQMPFCFCMDLIGLFSSPSWWYKSAKLTVANEFDGNRIRSCCGVHL